MTTIALAQSDAEIERCDPVMAELRGPLGRAAAFLERVRRRMRQGGYGLGLVHDGNALLDGLAERARAQGCTGLDLDSGHQRGATQRFYMTKGMAIGAVHFRLPLQGPGDGQGE